ncbi:BTAD domain-containing putative transcriptional regulator [Streptomyces sp. NPDC002588]|uniref:AfsR/SARP family transcriptional regulator n=1 Tax=Streptomyces sp. NPDC002588 TaxID=3154419 RepID=UPI00331D5AAC
MLPEREGLVAARGSGADGPAVPPDGEADGALRFEVLGPVRVWRGGRELDLGFPQQRALLALLLVRAGRPAPTAEVLDVLWAERPPASAPHVIRRYLAALRRLLDPGLPPRAPGRLPRRTGGHLLETTADEVDLLRFRELTRRGRRAAATGRSETAARYLTRALEEWRGPVAMGIPADARAHVQFTAVQRELLDTARLAADAALLCGQAEHVLPALRHATAREPLDEPLHARFILSLAACGLQAEALRAYDGIRRRLATDLSLTPGRELTEAHARVLRQEVSGERERTVLVQPTGSGTAGTGSAVPCPAQLPSAPDCFAGRSAESERLTAIADFGTAPGVVVVGGMAGVGKSALVLHWAHRAARRFPDGQLYVRLRGSEADRPAPEPADALRGMLAALGVPARRMPDGVGALAGLYRTLLAERRVLVVLDDAVDTQQLRPLLPASPGCLTVVTSRNALPGLVASGARPLRLEPPAAADAHAILDRRVGAGRTAAEPAATEEIVARCGRLPLALTAVADRAAARPHLPLAALAAELRAGDGGLDALPGVRDAFLSCHRRLSADGARLLLLLPSHPGPDITPAAAAALTGLPVRRARLLLAHLAESHLLTEPAPGRYTLHELLRAFATELAGPARPRPCHSGVTLFAPPPPYRPGT